MAQNIDKEKLIESNLAKHIPTYKETFEILSPLVRPLPNHNEVVQEITEDVKRGKKK